MRRAAQLGATTVLLTALVLAGGFSGLTAAQSSADANSASHQWIVQPNPNCPDGAFHCVHPPLPSECQTDRPRVLLERFGAADRLPTYCVAV